MAYPISIQLYTVRDVIKTPEDYRRTVKAIADIGYAAIEGGKPDHMSMGEFKTFLGDLGLHVSSTWAQPNKDNVNQIVDDCRELGVKQVVGNWGADNVKDLEQTTKTAGAFEQMAQLLQPHGLDMCYHCHWFDFVKHADGRYAWDAFFELAPTLRCEIDLYWASNFGAVDVVSLVKNYAHRTPLLHAKDGPLVKDQANTAVGKGKFDNIAPIKAADSKVTRYVIVELDKFDGDIMDAVRDSYDYLVNKTGLCTGRK